MRLADGPADAQMRPEEGAIDRHWNWKGKYFLDKPPEQRQGWKIKKEQPTNLVIANCCRTDYSSDDEHQWSR
jgi:hypothetical protein